MKKGAMFIVLSLLFMILFSARVTPFGGVWENQMQGMIDIMCIILEPMLAILFAMAGFERILKKEKL